MQIFLVLLVISIPILALAGLFVALVVARHARATCENRVDELELQQPIGPNHPLVREDPRDSPGASRDP